MEKKLLKIKKLDRGFLVENEGGIQFAYASLQEIANEIGKMFKEMNSKKLSVTVETDT